MQTEIILETKNLSKKFGNVLALDNVSVTLKKNHVYGFIGENGAGKSTFMKIISGLAFPTSGEFELMGQSDPRQIERMRKNVGTMIELPALYPGYTIRQNVELQRIIVGNPDASVTDRVIEMVGLENDKNKKAKNLSMGMKQRLGIAIAMVGNPKLLILDEPINGLDPKNIVALRNLLKKLSEENDVTIFVSSHILSELFLLATDFIFIHKGRIIERATHEEIEEKCSQYVSIKTENMPETVTTLEKDFPELEYKVIADDAIKVFAKPEIKTDISRSLMKAGIVITELSVKEQTLEEYFMTITGGNENA